MNQNKSIEEAADEYARNHGDGELSSCYENKTEAFLAGAKHQKGLSDAREKLLMSVISELKRAVNCDYKCKTNQDSGWMMIKCNCGAEDTLSSVAKKLEGL